MPASSATVRATLDMQQQGKIAASLKTVDMTDARNCFEAPAFVTRSIGMKCAVLLGVAFAAASWPMPLGATAPTPIELAYEVDVSVDRCPSEADFRRAIGRQLGFEPFASAGSVKVVAHLQRAPQGIEGVVIWRGTGSTSEGERRFLSAPDECAGLARAMEFAIAVQIEMLGKPNHSADPHRTDPDPRAGPPDRESDAAQHASVSNRAERSPAGAVPAPAVERRSAAWLVLVGAGPLVEWGTSPGTSPGARLFATLRREALSFELGVEANWPTTWRNDDGSGFRAWALAGTLAGCGHVSAFSLCGVGKAGRLAVTGFGVDSAASPAGWLVQVGARIAGSHRFANGTLASLHADLVGTPAPWTVELNRVPVWTTPSLAGLVGIDIAWPIL